MRTIRPTISTAARRGAIAAALLAAAFVSVQASSTAAPSAAESLGSVPAEVKEFITGGELLVELRDVYGLDASGERGTDFTDETETGEISRVFAWTDDYLAGIETDDVVRLLNEWIVPILVDDEPVGLATVWIQPETVLPELALFVPDPELALALSDVPDAAALVHDEGADAWFALQDETLTPLVAGRSGLESPAPLADVAIVPPADDAGEASTTSTGIPIAAGAGVLLLAAIALALLLPSRLGPARRARRAAAVPREAATREAAPAEGGSAAAGLRREQSLTRTGRQIKRALEREELAAERPAAKPGAARLGRMLKQRRSR